jgi:hypothetical protein
MPPHFALEAMAAESSSDQESPRTDRPQVQQKDDFMSYEEMLMQMASTTSTSSTRSARSVDTADTAETNELSVESCDSSCQSEEEEPFVHSKIRFDLECTQVEYVEPKSELTPEEFDNTWYSASEFSKISSWNRMLVKMVRQCGDLEEEPDHCIRGLEHRLSGQKDARSSLKTNSIYAVLQEQARQRRFKQNRDHEKIAQLYRDSTLTCSQEALERGKQDEVDAKEEEVKPIRRKSSFRKSMIVFDDSDLQELRDIMDHDEEDQFDYPSEELRPRQPRRRHSTSASSWEEDDDPPAFKEDKKASKKSKGSRISKLFKKKKGSSKSSERKLSPVRSSSKQQEKKKESYPVPVPERRRTARRMSM